MKKTLYALLAAGLMITGCQQDTRTTDEKFIDSLEKGLAERWKLTDKDLEDSTETFNSYVNAELSEIRQYKDENFDSADLKQAAEAYIASLEHTLEITPTLDKDPDKFYELYQPVYSERGQALLDINGLSPLEMGDKEDQKDLEELLDDAQITRAATDLASQFNFQCVKEDGDEETGWYSAELESKVKNDTEYTYDYFNLTVNFVDKDGAVLTQGYATVNTWKSGQTQTFELFTDKKFDHVELAKADYLVADNGFAGEIYFE